MRAVYLDGKELKDGNVFSIIKNNQTKFLKVVSTTTSKPGKHGSSKKLVKATDLRSGKGFEAIYGGSTNVYAIDDWEYKAIPIYMVDNGFKEFMYDLENEESVSLIEFDAVSQKMVDVFLQKQQGRNGDDILTDEEGKRLCLITNETDLEDIHQKFLWDIQYIAEEDLDKKVGPGGFYKEFMETHT